MEVNQGGASFVLVVGMMGACLMRSGYVGGVGDFGKFALLRHLMRSRRLAVYFCLSNANGDESGQARYFDYLRQPDKFQHLAPDLFAQLVRLEASRGEGADPLLALRSSGVLGDATFIRHRVPKQVSLRPAWSEMLVNLVGDADLVYLDPESGIEGNRLTNRHIALAEIAALRQRNRVVVVGHRQSGRRAEVKYLADRMKSLGCESVEIVRLRLVAPYLFVILDQDEIMSDVTSAFVKRWGNWVKSYRF
jgi:hypothetical protein